MYLPLDMMSGRYSMPAVWGLDILFALFLTRLAELPKSARARAAWAGLSVGLAVVMAAGIGKQEKFAARAQMLWDALHYVEQTAPHGAGIAWQSGDSLKGALNAEEGIHFQWHLSRRARRDLRVGLFDADGESLQRVEIPPLSTAPQYVLSGFTPAGAWESERSFARNYWFGRKRQESHLGRKSEQAWAGAQPPLVGRRDELHR